MNRFAATVLALILCAAITAPVFAATSEADRAQALIAIHKAEEFYNNKQYDQAITAFIEAVKLDPDDPVTHMQLAASFLKTGPTFKALFALNKAIKLDPTYSLARIMRANLFVSNARYEDAFADYRAILSYDPSHETASDYMALALSYRANTALEKGQYDQAIKDYKSASALNPDNKTYQQALINAQAQKAATDTKPETTSTGWETYKNGRFGFSVSYPADIFTMQPAPTNDDGRQFSAHDGAYFVAYGRFNTDFWEAIKPFQTDKLASEGYAQVTYKKAGENWLVLSGYRGTDIFYEKYIFSCKFSVINVFYMVYDKSLNSKYSPLIGRLNKNFKIGIGYDIEPSDCS